MKKLLVILLVFSCIKKITAQNYIAGKMEIYGPQYLPATTINLGGSIIVGNGGNLYFGGKISSADKVALKTPSVNGRSESITFIGTGTYSGTALVDGYVGCSGKSSVFILPTGNANTAYPITVPAGNAVTAAYFDGLGTTQSTTINGVATVVFSPYIDMPIGFNSGNYSVSYPSGFKASTSSSLLSSGNSSANGTTANSTYAQLVSVPSFKATGGSTSASLPSVTTTQIYFATLNGVLPVTIASFDALANGCTAELNWQTATESNSNYYAVESSTDGSIFTQVAEITSKNSAEGSSYSYTYNKLSGGITYFRLKAVDNDGSYTYSKIITVTGSDACNAGLLIKVWPNPTGNVVNLQGLNNGSRIMLVNVNGQKLMEVVAGGPSQTLSLSNYANGIYFLQIQNVDGSVSTVKVIKN